MSAQEVCREKVDMAVKLQLLDQRMEGQKGEREKGREDEYLCIHKRYV